MPDQPSETFLEHQREVLRYITDIGSSLRLHMDTGVLVERVTEASCKALRFGHSALYLSDGKGYFRAWAASGMSAEEETYLRRHPLPDAVVAQLIQQDYRLSESYFIPSEAPLRRSDDIASFFVAHNDPIPTPPPSDQPLPSALSWRAEDLLVVPLVSGDNLLLGLLLPGAPLNALRPTLETMALLELFANQAAVVIEGSRLYEEARQSSEERAALIEIGRVLSSPDAQRDLQTVYRTIYEQVRRVMPADVFFVTRYYSASDSLVMDFLVDEEVEYPPAEYVIFRPQTRQLLFEDTVGRLMSTAEDYKRFTADDPAEIDDTIGNDRPSQSLLFVPIRYSGKPLGFLSTQSYQQYAYSRRHLEMLKEIGVQAGIAMTNARLNVELRAALTQAQESERLKNHFLMTASHELRTPLTAVQGYIELLGSFGASLDTEIQMRFLNNARRACEELVLLLGNVMDTSRIDQDRVTLQLGAVHVAQAVEAILEILEPTIAREERPIETQIAGDLAVWADDLRLRQVLLNLVGNALKYTPAASKIAITAACMTSMELRERLPSMTQQPAEGVADHYVVIALRDWGPGIALEDQPRLFTKFMRLDSALNSVQRGAGLGLYLCRQLIEAMCGRIWLESPGIPGQGSTFYLALPRYSVCGK
ncbi:MAG: GAF domain-containing sensor histidine kinase [Chloroflexota bacterium]|nr:GAF domain-containing sensor histidine kinase [Chloroflexota bacterium]